MDRYEYLKKTYVDTNKFRLDEFEDALRIDPTSVVNDNIKHVGKYAQWILNLLVKHGHGSSDIENQKLTEALSKYDRIKFKLKAEYKDINHFKQVRTFYNIVDLFWEDKYLFTKAEWKKTVKRKYVKCIYEDDEFDVVVPLHEDASYELAGPPITQWCTAVKNDSAFHRYHADGPLMMVRDKSQMITFGKAKGEPRPICQIHLSSSLFCDREDNEFDLVKWLNKNEKLKQFFRPYFMESLRTTKRLYAISHVFFATLIELYPSKAVELKIFKLLRLMLADAVHLNIEEHGVIGTMCKAYGHARILDFVFKHLNEKIYEFSVRFRNYTGEGLEIPKSIGRFTQLRKLTLIGFVKKMPEAIGQLENLSVLSLGKNKVKTIPNDIKQCKNLEIIVLSNSDIKPDTINVNKKVFIKHGKIN
jgi:hypothetical protein